MVYISSTDNPRQWLYSRLSPQEKKLLDKHPDREGLLNAAVNRMSQPEQALTWLKRQLNY